MSSFLFLQSPHIGYCPAAMEASAMLTHSNTLDLVGLIDRYAPAQASILQQLEIRDIISLSRVCKRLSHVYNTTVKTQYSINDTLRPFFTSPVEFRNVQAETDAIICDSSAIRFFLRRSFGGVVLILVQKGASTARMLRYFKEDGWHETRKMEPHEDYDVVRCFQLGLPRSLTINRYIISSSIPMAAV